MTTRHELLDRWRSMVRIRRFEDRLREIVADPGIPGYVHTYAGQEAVAVGVIGQLRPDDWITSTYRGHGHVLARGVPLSAVAGEIWGRTTGVARGRGGSMHVADQDRNIIGTMGIVAAGLPIAAGAAFAARYRGQDRVAVSFFGDGAVQQGAFHEALTFASKFDCPVLFVCENNCYAEATTTDYHLIAGSVVAMAGPYRIDAQRVDGMDVFAVREAAAAALAACRTDGRPRLLEAMTYRFYGQYEGDDERYKPPGELDAWRTRDPLTVFRDRVVSDGALAGDDLDRVDREVRDEVERAIAQAQRDPWPDPAHVTADVYAAP